MTRIQLIILVALVAIIIAIAAPKGIGQLRISKAENQTLAIAKAFTQFRKDAGLECNRIQDLLENPGVSGWMGPYIDINTTQNPWGGNYENDSIAQKIGIPKGDKAPDKFEFGGSEEISCSYSEDMHL